MRFLAPAAALVAVLAFAPAAATQEEPAKPAAPAADEAGKRRLEKARQYLQLVLWKETMLVELESGFALQAEIGQIPKGFAKKFREVSDFDALETIVAEEFAAVLGEPALDGLIAFLQTEAGREYAAALPRCTAAMRKRMVPWAMENGMKAMNALMTEETPPVKEGEDTVEDLLGDVALDRLREGKRSSEETSAIATLRNLASCQAQIQTGGKIDCDRDGIGEHGTFLEMTGSAEVRAGFDDSPQGGEWAPARGDFTEQGSKVKPPIVSPALSRVDASGVVRKSGYCFRIYLPDSDPKAARFTHEVGPAEKVGLAGGTARVGVDMSETTWCAYAWPEDWGKFGKRAFFVNQCGDVIQSANTTTKWEGEKVPPGNAAFLGDGITAPQAIGTRGRDGEVWKVCN